MTRFKSSCRPGRIVRWNAFNVDTSRYEYCQRRKPRAGVLSGTLHVGGVRLLGFHDGQQLPLQILLGIGAPVLAAVFWGIFMAPKAVRPLPRMAHKVAELVIFGLAIVALYAAGQPMLAAIFAALFAVNFVLGLVWNQ